MADAEPIRLADGWTKPTSVGDWTIAGEPAFAESEAFNRLLRDLRLYVRDEIAGRSFLIAGHRGAGKTTTVVQAVRRLRTELLSCSADPESASLGRRLRLQRPLIVKLVGKSLLEDPPRLKEVEQRKELDRQAELARLRDAGQPAPANGGGASVAEKSAGPAENALVHITIALYRAFAGEVAQSYASHAALAGQPKVDQDARRNRMELAAQLALELDGTPEPALLRSYWDKLDRFDHGVLWPARVDQTMDTKALHGQGTKEIVAVAAAAQAFQVCSGAVTYKVSGAESASVEQTVESKFDFKELINRAAPLGAGALAGSVVGVSGAGRPVLGVATGLLVWLLSGLALSWSSTRKRKREQKLDYTFLRDRSIQTLDRDLPLVIERIREAGLAPVFVIDELDKLEREEAPKQISHIIDRLKHLVADYGFFCFLTDRDYFDTIERTVTNEAYPTEHTYFSQRLLVLNRSEDLFQYLRKMLMATPEIPSERGTAIDTFALAMIFRSRLNFADLNRILARFIHSDRDGDRLLIPEAELLLPGELKLAATLQLAIDQVVRDLDLVPRFNSDVAFEQLAIDALYYIPRCWEEDVKEPVDISRAAVKDCLLKRMLRKQVVADAPAGTKDPAPGWAAADEHAKGPKKKEPIVDSEITELTDMVGRLKDYLCNFKKLAEAVKKRENGKELANIVLTAKTRMLKAAGTKFKFTLDQLADEVDPAAAEPRLARSPAAAEPPQAFLLEFRDLIQSAELTVADLVASGLLPATVSDELLNAAIGDLVAAERGESSRLAAGLGGDLAFTEAIRSHGQRLADALIILVQAKHDAQSPEPLAAVLTKIARLFPKGQRRLQPLNWQPQLANLPLNATTGSVKRFRSRFENFQETPRKRWRAASLTKRQSASWDAWFGYFKNKYLGDGTAQTPFDYADLVLAAKGVAPGSVLRADLADMDAIDWSKAVAAALQLEPARADWLLFAGLENLTFDAEMMRQLVDDSPALKESGRRDVIDAIIRRGRSSPSGLLYVYSDQSPPARPFALARDRPMLAVSHSELQATMSELNWLADHGLIGGGIDGTGE